MAEDFNPLVWKLRIHWFSVKPSFYLLDPSTCSDFAREFMSEEKYYAADQKCDGFELKRLGRRFQSVRVILPNEMRYEPHGFWSLYLSHVAHSDYRGRWNGFAPMRITFSGAKDAPPLRIDSGFCNSLKPQVTRVYAHPNCYLFPIGWSVGIVVQLEGEFPLLSIADLVNRTRTEELYTVSGKHKLTLDLALQHFDQMIRSEMVARSVPRTFEMNASPYVIVNPLEFEGQATFHGQVLLSADVVGEMLTGVKSPAGPKLLITPGDRSVFMTSLKRGTLVTTKSPDKDPGVPGKERGVPGCSSSNLKNSLLVTSLMQKFHQNALGHKSLKVGVMRGEVIKTFAQLEGFWDKPVFRQICNAHTGIQKMRVPDAPIPTGTEISG